MRDHGEFRPIVFSHPDDELLFFMRYSAQIAQAHCSTLKVRELINFSWKVKIIMNKDQIKGKAKELAGKVQEQAGRVMGDETQQAKGLGKQAAGKTQQSAGNAKETLRKGTPPKGH